MTLKEHSIKSERSQGLIDFAYDFAKKAHSEQKRKYTGEPYINHAVSVALIVSEVTDDCDMLAAALLHDTVEDTEVVIEGIQQSFGFRIASFVNELTEFSIPSDGNRKVRKELDRRFLARASVQAQTIKLADLIDNSKSIVERDPDFAKIYMREKRDLLGVLNKGHHALYGRALDIVNSYY